MNNFHLCNHGTVRLSVSVVLMLSLLGEVQADTLYGPLKAGETLGEIVNQNYEVSSYPSSVIMREILRMNPKAFIANDVGRMRQGVVLTLPSSTTIRRAKQQRANSARSGSQATPLSSQLARSLETTLAQVRKERDQARRRTQQVELESAVQVEALNTRIKRLESDKRQVDQQFKALSAELDTLRQSLGRLRKENSQLEAKLEQSSVNAADNDANALMPLSDNNPLVAEKKEQIEGLEQSIAELTSEKGALKESHQSALSRLEALNENLEEKLAAQVQLSKAADGSAQFEVTLAELNSQHQQQLDQLQAVLKDSEASNDAKTATIASLRDERKALNLALDDAKKATASLLNENLITQNPSTADLDVPDTGAATDSHSLLDGPITKEVLTQQLEKPVTFPLWGLLLGAFALGFTSLMMLFTRRRKQLVPNIVAADSSVAVPQAESESNPEPLVFRVGNPEAQDPDVESLRIPPRIDPSRVAILDPVMTGSGITTDVAPPPFESQDDAKLITEPSADEGEVFEAKLKLLMAEAYEELGDVAAANVLLLEVENEGSEVQIAEANAMITRLDH